MPSGSFVEQILRVHLFCWFCHICLFLLSHLFPGYLHLFMLTAGSYKSVFGDG